MPELPEVETTKRGIEPFLLGKIITHIDIFQPRLRYPISDMFSTHLINHTIVSIKRRAKYLIIETILNECTRKIIIHLGMSGSLRIELEKIAPRKHDHVIFAFNTNTDNNEHNSVFLHFHDPRRFGFILDYLGTESPSFLTKLAPEPLSDRFNSDYLFNALTHRKKAIKVAIMDQTLVVGVGNIYASEALFMSKIHPEQQCTTLSPIEIEKLTENIKAVLNSAILQGGTTLKDFVNPQGNPGYFAQTLMVYGQKDLPCKKCATIIMRKVLGQRATYWCPNCQLLTQ